MMQSQTSSQQPIMYMQQSHPYPARGMRTSRQQRSMQQMPMQQMPMQQMPMQQMPMQQMPMQQMPMQQMPMQQKQQGGILSKLFGKKNQNPQNMYYMMPNSSPFMPMNNHNVANQQSMMQPHQQSTANTNIRMIPPAAATSATAANTSGGIGSFFSNLIANPSSIVGNVEKIVQVAQTVGPVVQQYGPLIRNFPSLAKVLDAINWSSTEATVTEETTEPSSVTQPEPQKSDKKEPKKTEQKKPEAGSALEPSPQVEPALTAVNKTSLPKLYV